jgi:hypothetical protein
MIWRGAVLTLYPALAVAVSLAGGGRGLAILLFFYLWVGAWAAFVLVWSSFARAAGRWNYERVHRTGRWTFGRSRSTS